MTPTKQSIVYDEISGQHADLYVPTDDLHGDPLPGLILLHGGAWQAGSKEAFAEWGPFLASQGYITMSINYRLSTTDTPGWPGVMDDVRSAYHWLITKTNLNIDVNKIGMIGASAGAHLASLIALEDRCLIKTVIAVYGVFDVAKWSEYALQDRDDDPVQKLMGVTYMEAQELYHRASPIKQLEQFTSGNTNVSFFVIWGDSDQVVPAQQSEDFVIKLRELGVKVKTSTIVGSGHYWFTLPGGGINEAPNSMIAPEILDFLNENLLK